MKITKEQLKQIIKEELSETDQSFGGSPREPEEEAFIDATYNALIAIGEKELTSLFDRLMAPERGGRRSFFEESKKRRTRK
jgi:hypothetical protein